MRKAQRERILRAMAREFMEPEIREGTWAECETSHGTEWIPADVLGSADRERLGFAKRPRARDVDGEGFARDFLDGECYSARLVRGFGARLSAPGYMDCTEWTVFRTRAAAECYLIETYWEGGEP